MNIRAATYEDRDAIAAMTRASLAESFEKGAETAPSDQSVAIYMGILDAYLNGQLSGTCLVADDGKPIGVLLAGEAPMNMGVEMVWGPLANWWVGYLEPTHRKRGIATQLLNEGLKNLRSRGFATMLAGTYIWNTDMIHLFEKSGAQPFQVAHTFDLRGGV